MAEILKNRFECPDVPRSSFKYFQALRNKGQLCDITLRVGDEFISAHCLIITAVIPFFRNILNSEKNPEDVNMSNVDPMALKCLIEFAYTCVVHIDAQNVRNLLAAACYLGVDAVRDACCDFLVDTFAYDNVLNIRNLAEGLHCAKLLKYTDCYITSHFEEVAKTESFLRCPSTYLKELVGKDDVNVDNEEKILEAVINWVKSSPDERSAELPELMRKVRLPLVKPLYLEKIAKREEIIRSSLPCKYLIAEAREYRLFPRLKGWECGFVTKSRRSTKTTNKEQDKSNYICVLHGLMRFKAYYFDLVEKEWHSKEESSFYLNAGSSIEANKKLYFFHSTTTQEYNPFTNVYRTLRSMPTPRICASATVFGNRIYVCGGQTGSLSSRVVECFNPRKNEWTKVCCMNISCFGPSSVTLNEYIFVLGGKDGKFVHDTVQKYDPAMNRWKTVSSLLMKRYYAGAIPLKGKIYVCGGLVPSGSSFIVSTSAEVYDPIENKSTFILSMTSPRSDLSLLPYHGKIWALGGLGNNNIPLTSIDVYEPESDTWTNEETDSRFRASGAVLI